jgi:hypothetical protein
MYWGARAPPNLAGHYRLTVGGRESQMVSAGAISDLNSYPIIDATLNLEAQLWTIDLAITSGLHAPVNAMGLDLFTCINKYIRKTVYNDFTKEF